MAGRRTDNPDSTQPMVQDDAHPTPLTSYVGLLIGFLLLLAMILLQAQADPLM